MLVKVKRMQIRSQMKEAKKGESGRDQGSSKAKTQ